MKIVEILNESVEPYYGYWVTHDGRIVNVPFEMHAVIAKDFFGLNGTLFAHEHASAKGWVPFTIENNNDGMSILIRPPLRMTKQSLDSTIWLLQELSKEPWIQPINGVFIDASKEYNYGKHFKVPVDRKPTLKAISWFKTHYNRNFL